MNNKTELFMSKTPFKAKKFGPIHTNQRSLCPLGVHSHRQKVEAKAKKIKEMWKWSKKMFALAQWEWAFSWRWMLHIFRTHQTVVARVRFRIRIRLMTVNKPLRNFVFYVTFGLFWLVGCSSFGVWCLGAVRVLGCGAAEMRGECPWHFNTKTATNEEEKTKKTTDPPDT